MYVLVYVQVAYYLGATAVYHIFATSKYRLIELPPLLLLSQTFQDPVPCGTVLQV